MPLTRVRPRDIVRFLGLALLASGTDRGNASGRSGNGEEVTVVESHGLIYGRGAYFWVDPADVGGEVVDVLGLWCMDRDEFMRLVAEAEARRAGSGHSDVVRWHTHVPLLAPHFHQGGSR
jgi:hypothetical protein